MKKLFNIGVVVDKTDKMENLLNSYRIGLNDWDKSKVMVLGNHEIVNYTIITTDGIFRSLCEKFNA